MRVRDKEKENSIRRKALEIIVEKGFDGLSMHKLAKEAAISPATIYIYFKDRDDLIIQISIEEWRQMVDATLQNFDPNMSFAEGLKIQWMNRVTYCLKNPLSMHFMEQIKFSPYIGAVLEKMDQTFQRQMKTFVQNAIKRKELVELPLEVYWSMAFSPLYSLVKFHMTKKGLPGIENFCLDDRVINQTLQLVLKALSPQDANNETLI